MSNYFEGALAEREFIELRSDTFVRSATKEENIHEHWDILDRELGRVDVKAAKRLHRSGPITYTIWWELRTVNRPPDWKPQKGWGVPNGIDRLIAVRVSDAYLLVKPEDIIDDLRKRCTQQYRGEFGLHTRPDRGDLMTILPLWYVKQNARLKIELEKK